MTDYLKLGQILKPQGIRGEVKLKPFVDDLGRFAQLESVFLRRGTSYEARAVQHTRIYKQFAYLKLSGCDDRNTAETLRNEFLYISRSEAAPLSEGAQYIVDLIGLDVVDESGALLGCLRDIFNTGSADIYDVQSEKPFLFPAAPGVILRKDMEQGQIVVDRARLAEVAVYA